MMAHIEARNTPTGYQTILSNGQNGYLADEPIAEHGTGLGFAPYDLLLSSLAACKTITIRYYARQKNWPLGDVTAKITLHTERVDDRTVSRMETTIHIEGELTDAQRTQLLRVADRCPVHRVLTGELTLAAAVWEEG
jgi:putative redox protein